MNIIITGTSSGIGYETVKQFAADSSHNIIAVSRNKEKLEKLKSECLQLNKQCNIKVIPFDLDSPDYTELISQINNTYNKVDILINNVGVLINKSFESFTNEDMLQTFNTNFFGPFRLIQKLLPLFISPLSHGEGLGVGSHIINIGSMGGFQGSSKFPGLAIYSASKAALANLTESLAEELKEYNIKVNCLALGAAQTEMLTKAFPEYKAPLSSSQMAQYISNFALTGHHYYNGKILPVSVNTP